MKINKALFLLFFMNFSMLCSQQSNEELISKNLNFHLLDVSAGLSHNYVNDITQDSLGFIWIATYDGLNRYDGKNFTRFKRHLELPASGLANNYIQDLVISSDDLLAATDAGLNIYNIRTDSFQLIDENKGLYNNASVIQKLPNGHFVVSSYHRGTSIIDENYKPISTLSGFLNSPHDLGSTEISTMTMVNNSILWIGSIDKGLWKVSIPEATITHSSELPDMALPSQVVNRVYADSEKNLWIGTAEGLMVKTVDGRSIYLKSSNEFQKGLSDNDILSFQEDRFGQMWIGTRNGGLNILNIASLIVENNPQVTWYLPRKDGKSVYNRTVSAIFRDRDHNMWLGTPTGVNYVRPNGEEIQLIKEQNGNYNSISHNRIGSLAKSSDEKVWIGTDGGGLDLFSPDHGTTKHFKHRENDPSSLSNDYLLSIFQQSSDSVWVGTYQGGLNLLNPKTGKTRHYLQGSISNGSDVRDIYMSNSRVLWVGTNRGGLFRYDPVKDQFNYIKNLGKIDIRDIQEDKEGNLWLATYGSGIIYYDPQNDTRQEYNQSNTSGLNSNVIFSILLLPDGDILAGSRYAGLLRFDPITKKIKSFTEKNGLSNNTINSLILEDSTYVWMGSYNGLNRYNIKTNEILNISSLDNIQEGEFNIGAALKANDGKLYFGGNNGLNIFNPELIGKSDSKFPIYFKGLKVLNEPVHVKSTKGSILTESIFFRKEISLQNDENTFSIEFAALKYPTAENIKYSYKLESYNEFWIESEGSGVANFTGVPPGTYNLLVKTSSGSGQENLASLGITVIPPFWQTLPAFILYILVLILLFWLASRYYSERVHLKNSLLFEQKQRKLEHDLNEERFRFFTAFSHELKTPLTLILAPVEELLSNARSKSLKEDLKFIHRNASSLFQTINKLLEFRKSEEGLGKIQKKDHNLSLHLKRWIENYYLLARDKNITIEYDLPEEEKIVSVDLEKIKVIFNNLISNAVKYSDQGSTIIIDLIYENPEILLQVSDDGPGISPEDLQNIFDWYYRSDSTIKKSGTGIGLALSKRFAELHDGAITVNSEPGSGSIFTLTIPLIETQNATEILPAETIETNSNFEAQYVKDQKATLSAKENRQVILIIDDNPEILRFLNKIFNPHYDILHANDGDEGIKTATKYVPDLIISDVMMPNKTGIDLCGTLKNQNTTSHIPIILLTAKGNMGSISSGYKEGADDYITKPFHPELLKIRVKNLLESRKKMRDLFYKKTEATDFNMEGGCQLLKKEKDFLEALNHIIGKHISTNSENAVLISKEIGMSRTSLYRKLKAITGKSINEYIRDYKIEMAADLIKEQGYTVSQASYQVGFNNLKYFRKVFKEKYGQNPSEYKV